MNPLKKKQDLPIILAIQGGNLLLANSDVV
jgi:hypothetical protein